MLRLEPALPEDETFLFRLFVSTRRDEFDQLGLLENQLDALMRMQYEAQKISYRSQFPLANHYVVVLENVPIGRMITDVTNQAARLVDISILSEHRGKGFGTMLIKQLQREATELGLPIKLHVINGNPAQRLYIRCGFYVTGKSDPFLSMQWDAE